MNTESQQQIAREAREEWFSHYKCVGDGTEANQILDNIILSAIERVTEGDEIDTSCTHPYPQMGCPDCGAWLQSTQPQRKRSEQQDLVDMIAGDLVRETNIFPNQVERAKELISQRLQRTQVAEIQFVTNKWTDEIVSWVIKDLKALCPTIASYDETCLRKQVLYCITHAVNEFADAQLTAERQRREQAERSAEESRQAVIDAMSLSNEADSILRQQLIDALAAIEEIKHRLTKYTGLPIGADDIKILESVDLSLLQLAKIKE